MGLEVIKLDGLGASQVDQSSQMNNAPSVAAIAQTIAANQGVINLSKGITYDVYLIPTSLTYSVTSTNAGAANTTIFAFNNNVLNALVTVNSGGVAASIVNTFGDGFSGKVYEQYFRSANQGKGIKIIGFTLQITTLAGVATPAAFSTLAMTILSTNGYGQNVPVSIDMNQALRNTQFNSGMLTLAYNFYLNSLTQISMSLPINTSLTLTLFTEGSGFTA